MSEETDRLAREAEERRSTLDNTIDDLKGRFSPGQIVDELSGYLREGQGADMVKNLNRQVRDNPLALGLVGAGIAWLMLGQGARDGGQRLKNRVDEWRGDDRDEQSWLPDRWAEDDRDNVFVGSDRSYASGRSYASDYQDDLAHDVPGSVRRSGYSSDSGYERGNGSSIGSKVSGAAGSVGSAASSAGSSIGSAASSVGSGIGSAASGAADAISGAAHAVGDALSSAADGASRLGHDTRDAAYRAGRSSYRGASRAGGRASGLGRRAQRSFLDTLQDEPLILGAIAVAVGAAIGAALPSTRTEDEWLGETRDRLRDDAIGYGKDALHKAENVAGKAYEAGSAEAEAKGLKPTGESGETMADKVSSVAQAAFSTARDEAKKEGLGQDEAKREGFP